MVSMAHDTLRLEALIYEIVQVSQNTPDFVCDRYTSTNSVDFPFIRRKHISLTRENLYSLCYLTDFESYRLNFSSISGEIYVRGHNRPVPIHFDKALDELITDGRLKEDGNGAFLPGPGCEAEIPPTIELDPLDELAYHTLQLSYEEKEVIRSVIERCSFMGVRKMNSMIRDDPPYAIAAEDQAIDYELVFYREEEQEVDDDE